MTIGVPQLLSAFCGIVQAAWCADHYLGQRLSFQLDFGQRLGFQPDFSQRLSFQPDFGRRLSFQPDFSQLDFGQPDFSHKAVPHPPCLNR